LTVGWLTSPLSEPSFLFFSSATLPAVNYDVSSGTVGLSVRYF
jgi:hypothetical protein